MINKLIKEFNALKIKDMDEITELHSLNGKFINLNFPLPNGQTVKLWKDDKTYYGNQVCKHGSNRCYGLAADEKYLLVCEYGDNGKDAEIIVFKRWN